VVSEIKVLESGLPPSGGVALPPNKEVILLMKVDLPVLFERDEEKGAP